MSKHFLYIADPMCSWCWGFSPVIERIAEEFGDRVPVRVMVGGLRPGTTEPMRDKDKEYVSNHWDHVHEASGQPFDFGFFDQEGFVYDTEPACRAVVTARSLDDGKVLGYLGELHRAFYADNRDSTDPGTLADIAEEYGYSRGEFELTFASPEIREETLADFNFARQCNVSGFPTLLAVENRKPQMVTAGFQKWDVLAEPLAEWVNGIPQATT
jgi:putative protein-disulfide isomerase